jgi:hypothetical protein
VIHDRDLWDYQGKRVRVVFKDGRKAIGVIKRDVTDKCWELMKSSSEKTKGQPPGIGEILFLPELASVEEFSLKQP